MGYVFLFFVPLIASLLIWTCIWKLVGFALTGVLFATHTFWGYDLFSMAAICTCPTMILCTLLVFPAHPGYGVLLLFNVLLSMPIARLALTKSLQHAASLFTATLC